jgi:hypothetical protein
MRSRSRRVGSPDKNAAAGGGSGIKPRVPIHECSAACPPCCRPYRIHFVAPIRLKKRSGNDPAQASKFRCSGSEEWKHRRLRPECLPASLRFRTKPGPPPKFPPLRPDAPRLGQASRITPGAIVSDRALTQSCLGSSSGSPTTEARPSP